MRQRIRVIAATVVLLLMLVLGAIAALGQSDSLTGKYVGVAKSSDGSDVPLTLELKSEGGKITGHLMSGQTKMEISEATLSEAKLTLRLGEVAKDGVLTAKVDGSNLVGEWIAGSQKKTVELKRGGETDAAAAAPASSNLNGQWEGVADANGQPFPFTLMLKIEGETVTGNSSSQLGESSISTGTWKDGKLNFQVNGQSGVITMSATVVEGKLTGEFDYAGQLQGRWVAVKRTSGML